MKVRQSFIKLCCSVFTPNENVDFNLLMSRLLVLQHLEREGPGLFVNLAEERGI